MVCSTQGPIIKKDRFKMSAGFQLCEVGILSGWILLLSIYGSQDFGRLLTVGSRYFVEVDYIIKWGRCFCHTLCIWFVKYRVRVVDIIKKESPGFRHVLVVVIEP